MTTAWILPNGCHKIMFRSGKNWLPFSELYFKLNSFGQNEDLIFKVSFFFIKIGSMILKLIIYLFKNVTFWEQLLQMKIFESFHLGNTLQKHFDLKVLMQVLRLDAGWGPHKYA